MKDDKPSATAYLIARSTVALARDPILGGLIPVHSAEISQQFIGARPWSSRWLDGAINSRLLRPLANALERATIPGIKLHYALRKQYLEETARDAIVDGIRQIIIIGAGFDTLALRLHKSFPETEFIEVDHPATQRVKKLVADRHRADNSNLRFVALDLARSNLAERLASHPNYRADDRTLFIAEGLLMYLAPEAVSDIFSFVGRHACSRFAFTFMELQNDGRIGFRNSSRAVDAWLRFRGESFRWGIEKWRVNEFLEAKGFKLLAIATSQDLKDRYLRSAQLKSFALAEGECICVAERS